MQSQLIEVLIFIDTLNDICMTIQKEKNIINELKVNKNKIIIICIVMKLKI